MRFFFFALLFLIFLWGTAFNYASYWKRSIKGEKYPSVAPLIPGVIGVVSFCLSPYPVLRHYAWLPFIIDPGCALSIIICNLVIAKQAYRHNRFFIIATLHSVGLPDTSVVITLYKGGRYILKKKNNNPWSVLSHPGEWLRRNDILELTVGKKPVVYTITDLIMPGGKNIKQLKWSERSAASVLDNIDLQLIGKSRF